MSTAREIMTPDAQCAKTSDTVLDAAKRMADLDVGALPICGEGNRLKGMITDRDIVTKVLAQDKDPRAVRVGDLAEGKPVTIGADDGAEEILQTMAQHQVRRPRSSTGTTWSASSRRRTSPDRWTNPRSATC